MSRLGRASFFCLLAPSGLLLSACGGAETPEPVAQPDPEPLVAPNPEAPPTPTRVLALSATFGDVVTRARELDEAELADSDAGCLLELSPGAPPRLQADLAVAVRPLPEAPASVDSYFDRELRLLTRHGAIGDGAFALSAFTAVPLSASTPVTVLIMSRERQERVTLREPSTDSEGLPVLFVVAAADVPLSDVVNAVEENANAAIAFAVPLPEETRLPEATAQPVPELEPQEECEGLPELAADLSYGEIPVAAFQAPVSDFRERAPACGRGTAVQARYQVAVRIDPRGLVTEACVSGHQGGDRALGECLLEALRSTAFPIPEPTGFVDVNLPLVLSIEPEIQRLRCR